MRFNTRLLISSLISALLVASEANALRSIDVDGSGNDIIVGDDVDAVAVYRFDEAGGNVATDTSGVGAPLDLTMSTAGNLPSGDGTPIRTNAMIMNGYLLVNPKPNGVGMQADMGYESAQRHRTFLESSGAATKLNSCTNGFTIQAIVRPWFPFQGNNTYGNTIVGLSNTADTAGSRIQNANFALLQTGNSGSEAASVRVRTGTTSATAQASVTGGFSSVRETDNLGKLTEIIATQEPSGVLTVYVNRIPKSSLTAVPVNFTSTAKLLIGNELAPLSPPNAMGVIDVSQQSNWSGEIHHLAIYCKGFTRTEILGALEQNKAKQDVVRPDTTVRITETRMQARRLMERLTGTIIPIDHPMVGRVDQKIMAGDRIGAVKIITGDVATGEAGHPDFLNTVVKQFALKMSNREETIRVPLNDFAASFIGITRDERNAKELLTGDFYYMADPAKAKVRTDFFRDILLSNNHYDDIEKGQWDIGKVLMRVAQDTTPPANIPKGQQIALSTAGAITPNPDPAGVITSRAFMSAHAVAGTNRRLVEYAFREFMCVPMQQMADTSASPARIGRDVERTPGGDAVKFETSCKGCHTVMDGFRGAFARFDYSNITIGNATYGVVRHTQLNKTGDFAFGTAADRSDVVRKMNHNETVFPTGYEITDDSFVNNAVGVANRPLFGWTGARARGGVGVNQFGQMIADSERFTQCMAKRAIETVCNAGMVPENTVTPFMQSVALKFKESGYKLRTLFQEAAATPNCTANLSK